MKIEKVTLEDIKNSVYYTRLVDKGMPKTWKCPHCGNKNTTGQYADEILMEHFKYLEHCEQCGYVHAWELSLSDKFKDQVIALVRSMNGKG